MDCKPDYINSGTGKLATDRSLVDSETTKMLVNKRKMGPRKKIVQSENTNFPENLVIERTREPDIRKLSLRKHVVSNYEEDTKREPKVDKKLSRYKSNVLKITTQGKSKLNQTKITDRDEYLPEGKRKKVYKKRGPKPKDPAEMAKRFICDVCLKTFKYSTKLRQHSMIHTDYRPFDCDVCSAKFRSKADLCRHLRIHTRETPYGCDSCAKRFKQRAHLIRHVRTHTMEAPFECGFCQRRFNDNSHLTIHKRLHTGSRPYQCDGCEKNFISSSNLQIHKRSHTLERSYVCPLCTRSFSTSGSLVRHTRTHTQEKPYQCEFCTKRFCDGSNLRVHRFIHTRNPHKSDVAGAKSDV